MSRKGRTERIPFGVPRLKLDIDQATKINLKGKGRVPRWINDSDTRISDAMAGGYEFVNDDRLPVSTEQQEGTEAQSQERRIRKAVGKNEDGSTKYAYLMAIPEEFYQEDQAKKEERNKMVDIAIKGGAPPGLDNHGVSPDKGRSYVKNVDYKP
jgi:hypothetical protein